MRGLARGQGGAGRRGSQLANPLPTSPIAILPANGNSEKNEPNQWGAGSYRSSSLRGSLTLPVAQLSISLLMTRSLGALWQSKQLAVPRQFQDVFGQIFTPEVVNQSHRNPSMKLGPICRAFSGVSNIIYHIFVSSHFQPNTDLLHINLLKHPSSMSLKWSSMGGIRILRPTVGEATEADKNRWFCIKCW